ncbi:hypothetical protein BsWGS_25873 [Bradybaena similaris]
MLLYAGESVYPSIEFETLTKQSLAGKPILACARCGDICQSEIAARHLQKLTCPATIRDSSNLRGQMMSPHHHVTGGIKATKRKGASTSAVGDLVSDSSSRDTNCSDLDKSTDSDLEPVDTGSGGEYKCDECPKSFQWKANLQRHQLTHDADRKFPCENCDKLFTDPSNLQRHIRSQHVGARSHACSECGKTFATSSGLKQHQHIHSSFKPFQCEVCLKAYTQFSNLCRHKRMHADCRQQIRCKDCGQAFSTVTSLSKHKRFCEGATGDGKDADYNWENTSPMLGTGRTGHLASPLFSYTYTDHPARNQLPLAIYPNYCTIPLQMPHGVPAIMGVPPLSRSMALYPASYGQQSPAHMFDECGFTDKTVAMVGSLKRRSILNVDSQSSEVSDADSSDNTDSSDTDMKEATDDESTHSKCWKRAIEVCEPESQFIKRSTIRVPTSQLCSKLPETSSLRDSTPATEVNTALSGFAHLTNQSTYASSTGNATCFRVLSPTHLKPEISADHPGRPARTEFGSPSSTSIDVVSPQAAAMVTKAAVGQLEEMPLDLSQKHVNSRTLSAKGSTQHTHIKDEIAYSPASSASPKSSSSTPISSVIPVASELLLTLPFVPMPRLKAVNSFSYSFSPFMMESILRLKEGIKLQQEATNMYPCFNTSNHGNLQGLRPRHFSLFSRPEFPNSSQLLKLNLDSDYSNHEPRHEALHSNQQQPFDQQIPGKSKERYACKYCGKLFPRSANLTRHLRTHTGEQPYKCKYCERSFSISSNLQRHVRNIHNKEKPFRCPICDRCFGQQTNLDRHLKKHEQEGPQVSESPTAELEDKDDAYISEIRNFIGDNCKINDADTDDEHDQQELNKESLGTSDTALQRDNKEVLNGRVVGNCCEDVKLIDMDIADINTHSHNESLVVDDAILEFRQKKTIINQTEKILSNAEVRKL